MLHDPTRVTDGIELTDDPILAARRGIYEVSVVHRTAPEAGRAVSRLQSWLGVRSWAPSSQRMDAE